MKKLFSIMLTLSLLASLLVSFGTVAANTSEHELLDFTVMEDLSISARTSREMWGLALTHIINGNHSNWQECYRSMGGSSDSNIDEWIVLDLGEVYNIDKYGFATHITASAEGMPRAFTISVSHTGKEWTQVYSENSLAPATGTLIYEFEFEETEARFIKLHVTELAGPIGASTYEVQLRELFVYGTPVGHELLDFPAMEDVSVSAKTSRETAELSVNHLINGDISSSTYNYMSNSGSDDIYIDEWIMLDLGREYIVGTFGFEAFAEANSTGMPREFTISVSDTGLDGTWTQVFYEEFLNVEAGKRSYYFTFESVKTRYIKMHVTELGSVMGSLYDIRLRELYVYGTGVDISPHKIGLSKIGNDFIVNIEGWNPNYRYQIWTWKEVTSDTFGTINQWVLSQSYTLGSAMTQEPDGSISADLGDDFVSPDKFYTVAVKVIDWSDNFVAQHKTAYTPANVGEVVIEKVEVDGVFADERTVVKDIEEETVNIEVFTNITDGVTYEATVNPGNTSLTPDGNTFDWEISALEPGRYTVNLKAQNGEGTSDERVVRFNLYKVDETIVYGQMDTMTVTGGVDEGVFAIDIDPDIPSGNWVNYTISEPWRAAIHRSSSVEKETAQGGMTDVNISEGEYGIYQVATYVRRSIGGSADDGMIRRVEYARDGAKSLDIEVDGDGYTSGTLTKDEGEQITITPDADLVLKAHEQMEYSYWRRDARGWVMIRNYSTIPELTWTPARVGLYTIQVRAKGSDAGSYELIQNIEFNVTGADPLLTVDEITLSGTDNVDARVPVTITADAVNPSSEDLLYKYIISNDYIYYVETAYSADPTYIWTPGKAGEYRISVLVKNQASFGKYDDVQTFIIDVE